MTDYSTTDFKALTGRELRRANDEYFERGTGPRAVFELRSDRDSEFRRMVEVGALTDLAPTFARVLNAPAIVSEPSVHS